MKEISPCQEIQMRYLLDTNIVSETYRKNPNQGVIQWLKETSSEKLYISVLIIGKIRKGIEKLEDTQQKIKLITWLDNVLLDWFGDKILHIDLDVAEQWGFLRQRVIHSLRLMVS